MCAQRRRFCTVVLELYPQIQIHNDVTPMHPSGLLLFLTLRVLSDAFQEHSLYCIAQVATRNCAFKLGNFDKDPACAGRRLIVDVIDSVITLLLLSTNHKGTEISVWTRSPQEVAMLSAHPSKNSTAGA